jgi:hypothetical protein
MAQSFKENQRLRGVLLLFLVAAGIALAIYQAIVSWLDSQSGFSATAGFLTLAAGLSALLHFLLRLRMKLSINQKRIKFKLRPFHKKSRQIKWKEVEECRLVKTHPLAPNHGSAVALGGERSFTLCGRNGLAITLKNGRRYFIGCKDVEALDAALPSFG